MKNVVKRFKDKLSLLDTHSLEVIKKSSSSTIVNVSGIFFGVIVSIFLGRALGADGLGVINLSNQIVGIVLMLCLLGMPSVVVKEVSIAFGTKNWKHANSVISTSLKVNGILGSIIASFCLLAAPFVASAIFHEPRLEIPLSIASVAMVFQVFSRIFAAGVNGYRKIWQSSLVGNVLSFYFICSGLLFLYFINYKVTIVVVAWLYGISRVLVAFLIGVYWKYIRHPSEKTNFIPAPMLKVALPLLFAQTANIFATSADTLMLGLLSSAEDVGLYSVAFRIAFFSSFFLQVTNAAIAPKVASMYSNRELKDIEKMVQTITKGLVFIAFLVSFIIILFGKHLLSIWGVAFEQTYSVLLVLTAGQLINISSGCVSLLLTMCGQEKVLGALIMWAAVLNITLNYFFIQKWGFLGAGVSTAITMSLRNICAVIIVKKRLGILTLPISFLRN